MNLVVELIVTTPTCAATKFTVLILRSSPSPDHAHLSSGRDFMMALGKPKRHTEFEVASFSVADILKGAPKFWGASIAQGHAHVSSVWDFMMGLGKPEQLAKFEVAGFIYYGNIRKFVFKNLDKPEWGNPLFWGGN